jgi:hypothetical protein
VHPSLRVSAQMLTPHVGTEMTVASTWSSQSVPCRAVSRRCHATASWPLVRPWSLGVVQQLPGHRQRPRSGSRRSPGCLRGCMRLCSVHNNNARHWAVGNLWRGRSSFFLHQEIHQSLGAMLNDLHHHAEQETSKNLKPKPPT